MGCPLCEKLKNIFVFSNSKVCIWGGGRLWERNHNNTRMFLFGAYSVPVATAAYRNLEPWGALGPVHLAKPSELHSTQSTAFLVPGECVCVCACVYQGNQFNHAQIARFNNPTFLPLLQTMSSLSCPAGGLPGRAGSRLMYSRR